MISRFLSIVILLPLAVLIVVFCVANRAPVTVSLDPLGTLPQFVYQVPLFLVLMAAVIAGVVLGGVGTFFTQSHHRRSAAARRREVERLQREAADAKERLRQERESRAFAPAGGSSLAVLPGANNGVPALAGPRG